MADIASLAVALHLNAANFRSQFSDTLKAADRESTQFNRNAQRQAEKTQKAYHGCSGTVILAT